MKRRKCENPKNTKILKYEDTKPTGKILIKSRLLTTKLPNHQTTKLPNYLITKIPKPTKPTKPPNYQTTKLPNYLITKISKLPNYPRRSTLQKEKKE